MGSGENRYRAFARSDIESHVAGEGVVSLERGAERHTRHHEPEQSQRQQERLVVGFGDRELKRSPPPNACPRVPSLNDSDPRACVQCVCV